jgi:hypothetical protein
MCGGALDEFMQLGELAESDIGIAEVDHVVEVVRGLGMCSVEVEVPRRVEFDACMECPFTR